MTRQLVLLSIVVLACFSLTVPASGVELKTWEGDDATTPTSWNVGQNWDKGSVPATGDDLLFPDAGSYTGALTLDAAFSINEITVEELASIFGSATGTTYVDLANAGSGGPLTMAAQGGTDPSITVTMPGNNGVVQHETLRFSTDIVLNGDLTITRNGVASSSPARYRRLSFNGDISGTGDLTIDNKGSSWNYYTELWGDNTFVGDVKIDGGVMLKKATGLGDGSNDVTFGTARGSWLVIIDLPNNAILPYDMALSSNRNLTIYSGWYTHNDGKTHTFSGDITGGGAHNALDIYSTGRRMLVFTGSNQTFTASEVDMMTGAELTIAGANAGVAWENVTRVDMMVGGSPVDANHQQALLLRGDFALNPDIRIEDTANANYLDIVTLIGQDNGATPFNATFDGDVDVREDDFPTLQLTADAGGSATFSGDLYSNSATFNQGFKKVGDGTVIFSSSSRVAQDANTDGTAVIGPVGVNKGTLLINTDHFYATTVTVADGATLGGTGNVNGNVTVEDGGTLAPGASTGRFDIILGNYVQAGPGTGQGGVLSIEIGGPGQGTTYDYVTVGGTATLDGVVEVALIGGYLPTAYDTFDVLTATSIIDNGLDISYSGPGLIYYNIITGVGYDTLQLTYVPEPGTMLLLGAGLVALVRRRRK